MKEHGKHECARFATLTTGDNYGEGAGAGGFYDDRNRGRGEGEDPTGDGCIASIGAITACVMAVGLFLIVWAGIVGGPAK